MTIDLKQSDFVRLYETCQRQLMLINLSILKSHKRARDGTVN